MNIDQAVAEAIATAHEALEGDAATLVAGTDIQWRYPETPEAPNDHNVIRVIADDRLVNSRVVGRDQHNSTVAVHVTVGLTHAGSEAKAREIIEALRELVRGAVTEQVAPLMAFALTREVIGSRGEPVTDYTATLFYDVSSSERLI